MKQLDDDDYDDIHKNSNDLQIHHSMQIKYEEKPILLFTNYDITKIIGYHPMIQYLVLSLGLLICMCLYGYYQELVAYNIFQQQLSIFSTFIHFFGCYLIAYFQRKSMKSNKYGNIFTMGKATYIISLQYYSLLIILKSISMGLTNYSMTQINYPAKVLFKSATPVINMLIGLLWFHKSYPLRDYIVVILLVIGLYIFLNGESNVSPQGTQIGIIYVIIAMLCGGKFPFIYIVFNHLNWFDLNVYTIASVPMIQEYCMNTFNATVEELLYHSFLGSTIISFIFLLFSGELQQGYDFIINKLDLYVISILILFSLVGYYGSNFSVGKLMLVMLVLLFCECKDDWLIDIINDNEI